MSISVAVNSVRVTSSVQRHVPSSLLKSEVPSTVPLPGITHGYRVSPAAAGRVPPYGPVSDSRGPPGRNFRAQVAPSAAAAAPGGLIRFTTESDSARPIGPPALTAPPGPGSHGRTRSGTVLDATVRAGPLPGPGGTLSSTVTGESDRPGDPPVTQPRTLAPGPAGRAGPGARAPGPGPSDRIGPPAR
eukprot:746689-Hanusia_phi.AAC.1